MRVVESAPWATLREYSRSRLLATPPRCAIYPRLVTDKRDKGQRVALVRMRGWRSRTSLWYVAGISTLFLFIFLFVGEKGKVGKTGSVLEIRMIAGTRAWYVFTCLHMLTESWVEFQFRCTYAFCTFANKLGSWRVQMSTIHMSFAKFLAGHNFSSMQFMYPYIIISLLRNWYLKKCFTGRTNKQTSPCKVQFFIPTYPGDAEGLAS